MGKDLIFGKFTSGKMDNHKIVVSAASDITYHINSSGTDTSSNIYFDFERPAEKVIIATDAVCSLVELNGKTFKSPRTISAGANKIELRVERFKIVTTAQAALEVSIK